MVVFPNCKINLGLHIVRKREDGYHNLETIFYPLPLCDVLEVVNRQSAIPDSSGRADNRQSATDDRQSSIGNQQSANPDKSGQTVNRQTADGNPRQMGAGSETTIGNQNSAEEHSVSFHLSGLPVQGKPQDNLCIKAYNLLKKDHPQLADVHLYLHKAIPMGAGLGGGSADGAFTLQLLNDKFQLNLSREKLLDYSLQLGSDCPFFIINKPCYATGRGELLQAVQLDLSAYSFLVVHPGVHINTGWAFSQLTPSPSPLPLQEIIQQPITSWRMALKNDFEAPVFIQYPELKAIKEKLYDAGALYASMSGSGSCFFGIFPKHQLPAIQWPVHYAVFNLQ